MSDWKKRYEKAHRLHQEREYPTTTKDFGWLKTNFPDVRKSNGLTNMICNYLNWIGQRATRINVEGRMVETTVKTEYGNRLTEKKWKPSMTRVGSADISSTIMGRSAMWEVKIWPDKPREKQLAEQAKERRAGGIYEFVGTPEEFFDHLDKLFPTLVI